MHGRRKCLQGTELMDDLSDAYFKLLEEKPALKPYFALGEKVIVCLDDKTAVSVE